LGWNNRAIEKGEQLWHFSNAWQHLVTGGNSGTFWQIFGNLRRLESSSNEFGINWKWIGKQFERD